MRRLVLLAAGIAAVLAAFVALTLPPRHLTLTAWADGSVAGVLHIHTNRSDGLSSPDEVAAAAARAGLAFLVFTDHGDATRPPDPPQYRFGVLCLDGVEISTNGGHYVAIDMPASPYPLAGEPRDVVEDVRRLGGFGIVAHPDSPKAELQWREWNAPFDGIELLNPDTSWRVLAQGPGWRPRAALIEAIVDYPFRSPEVIASVFQPTRALGEWEPSTRTRRVVTVAGTDAHARLSLFRADPGETRFALPFPSYEASFRTLSVHVWPEAPFTGRAADDAASLVRGIRAGHLYTAIDAVASPPAFELSATNQHGSVQQGDVLQVGGGVLLHVRSNAPPEFVTVVHEGLKTLAAHRDAQDLTVHASDKAAVYWVEIVSADRKPPVTWIRSNPIYVRSEVPDPHGVETPQRRPAESKQSMFNGTSLHGWDVEHLDPKSSGAVDLAEGAADHVQGMNDQEMRFRYGLAEGPPSRQVAALRFSTPNGLSTADRVTFTVRAEHPMRISVQLRSGNAAGDRWQRSVYVDGVAREHTVYFDDVTPVGMTSSRLPRLDEMRALLFVVDLTNTKPGSSGNIWLSRVALEK